MLGGLEVCCCKNCMSVFLNWFFSEKFWGFLVVLEMIKKG